jgi:uncharacterized damage-inducible protein DinB
MHLTFDELLRYTNEEREKWRGWFATHPEAMEVELQPGGRFATTGALIDHVFLVERRHLQRLRGVPLDNETGLSGRHSPPLFDYGASVRRELDQFASELDDEAADEPRKITVLSGGEFTRRGTGRRSHSRSAAPVSSRQGITICSIRER